MSKSNLFKASLLMLALFSIALLLWAILNSPPLQHDSAGALASNAPVLGTGYTAANNSGMTNSLPAMLINDSEVRGNINASTELALKTRQQLSVTALSLANQGNQAVLRLFP